MADRSHPLLDRLEAAHSPAPLRSTCEAILRVHWAAVTDIGDAPYDLVANLLKHSSAQQLALLEANSPHIAPFTDNIWKELCISEFIDVRKLVEDGRLKKEDEPASWRDQYAEEEAKRESKMQAILSKMRGQYSQYNSGRGTVQSIDGLRQEKRRKTTQPATGRPKTLFEKAKSNSRAITSIYAPKRRVAVVEKTPRAVVPSAASPPSRPARPPPRPVAGASKPPVGGNEGEQKKPLITTVVRTLKRPHPDCAPISTSSLPPRERPATTPSTTTTTRHPSRLPSFSPPLPHSPPSEPSRPASSLSTASSSRTSGALSPPPLSTYSPVAAPPPRPPASRTPSLFMPKPRRP
ncbi:hypothetical protein JCM8097_008581 [Rhodosporidiobolus ruineniae]